MGLLEPVLQHMLEVNALPVAGPGVELYLQGADADVAAALLRDGLQSQDLQVDGGGLLQRPEIHPQLSLQHLGEHQLRAELEEAAAGLPVHLHQGLRCQTRERPAFNWQTMMKHSKYKSLSNEACTASYES